ncbi:globin domain-containing protein [Pararhodonellum marinum]|uniref:globin domain-containing protein n=1 Tax=Pararhodonellum marinum TaxID=2755358 RepID=UPI00188F3D18|nr:cyanoglobin [Pararhodonellum marinum]
MSEAATIYQTLGEKKIQELVKAFYKEVANTPDLRRHYPEDLSPAEERLFLFLVQVFGGPSTYSEKRGHPRLRMRHLKWPIDTGMRDFWMNCMWKALDQTVMEIHTRDALKEYFTNAANHMINQ